VVVQAASSLGFLGSCSQRATLWKKRLGQFLKMKASPGWMGVSISRPSSVWTSFCSSGVMLSWVL